MDPSSTGDCEASPTSSGVVPLWNGEWNGEWNGAARKDEVAFP